LPLVELAHKSSDDKGFLIMGNYVNAMGSCIDMMDIHPNTGIAMRPVTSFNIAIN
jgi:hypothetical protein